MCTTAWVHRQEKHQRLLGEPDLRCKTPAPRGSAGAEAAHGSCCVHGNSICHMLVGGWASKAYSRWLEQSITPVYVWPSVLAALSEKHMELHMPHLTLESWATTMSACCSPLFKGLQGDDGAMVNLIGLGRAGSSGHSMPVMPCPQISICSCLTFQSKWPQGWSKRRLPQLAAPAARAVA